MLRRTTLVCWLSTLCACASADDAAPSGGAVSGRAASGEAAEPGEPLPLQAQPPSAELATFVDPDTGFSTQDVHDVDREVVHFDGARAAMIWGADGTPVSGWTASGTDLRWNGRGGFRVRFGTEEGERRAYFTETGPGTVCDLDISAPELLSIRPSNETPPQTGEPLTE